MAKKRAITRILSFFACVRDISIDANVYVKYVILYLQRFIFILLSYSSFYLKLEFFRREKDGEKEFTRREVLLESRLSVITKTQLLFTYMY